MPSTVIARMWLESVTRPSMKMSSLPAGTVISRAADGSGMVTTTTGAMPSVRSTRKVIVATLS
jgi:hypothetical protein